MKESSSTGGIILKNSVSIIVPVYNVGRYIDKCLQSILSQTYKNIEIIIVNDGSKDDSGEIIAKYASDDRIVYIEQDNAGVSAARNRGIQAATGEYLGFVDSDDYIEPEMYEKLLDALLSADADMAVCNYNLIYDDHAEKQYSKMRGETVKIYNDVYGYFCKYCTCPKPNNYIWTKLYKTGIVKKSGVRFENFKLGDDTLFYFKLLPHIRKAVFIDDGLYNYLQRTDSNVYTAAQKVNLAKVYADAFDSLADYYRVNAFSEFLDCLPIHAYSRLRSVFFYSRLAGMDDAEITESLITGFRGRKIADYLTGVLL